ncbi:nucleotide exchange factor GrpE [Gryllotalpicola reticulitermitis]|uniref:Nucleotide exchange factor GrpE n=1 Tax=Gryllotalpicola reticulitermitis TaxID=1184153 RepID=A0ABV8QD35_9MICO
MTAEETAPALPGDRIAELAQEVGQLRDLFQRRLLDDKAKNVLIETVQEQARAAQELLRRKQLESLLKEALLAVDRLRTEDPSRELSESVSDELLEVFRRRGLQEIDDSGDFDGRMHQIVATVPASDTFPAGSIVDVRRQGYLLEDRVLRPAQVTIATAADDRESR